MASNRSDSWTEEEDRLLQEIYPISAKKSILSRIKRSWSSIRTRAHLKGLRRDPLIIKKEMIEGGKAAPARDDFWTEAELEYLKEHYWDTSREEILSHILSRSWKTIRGKANKSGISRNPDVIRKENLEYSKKALKKKHGVESSFSLESTQKKIKQIHLEKRGVEYPTQSDEVRDKVRKTVNKKYGVYNVFQSEDIKLKIRESNAERHGVDNPLKNAIIKKKVRDTCLERYRVDNAFKLISRIKKGMLKKYGVEHPLQSPKIREKWVNTNIKRYGHDYPSQNDRVREKLKSSHLTKDVKEKKYLSRKRSHDHSGEEKEFFNVLKVIDRNTVPQEIHPEYKWEMDYYLPKFNLWVQYDGIYWHGKYGVKGNGKQAESIRKIIERDKLQNEKIINMIRFWSDDINDAIKNGNIHEMVKESIDKKIKEIPQRSHQYLKKQQYYNEDIKELPFNPDKVKARDFILSKTSISKEISDFIKRYEWLESVGTRSKWCFVARYKGFLAGVIIVNEPNSYSYLLGKNTKRYEALIQRGATVSWAPKNLGSRLLMFSCRWMVENTDKRFFVGYADPDASEVGFIYQACGFDFLGGGFGSRYRYRHPDIGREFTKQYLSRTSTFKRWCKDNGIEFKKEWLKDNGFKDLSKIPEDLKDAWNAWKRKIIKESEKIEQPLKYKYVLLLGQNKKEKSFLENLRKYKEKGYIKSYSDENVSGNIQRTGVTSSRKTDKKIEFIIKNHEKLTRAELARSLNESERWVKRQVNILIKRGTIIPKR